jgi:FixJ family two-component response regulator
MPTQKQNVVVVDDDMSMNQAIKRLLLAGGFAVVTFQSAEALLESDAADNAGCLVLDMRLPGMSGFELQQRLKQGGAERPVIFITAHDLPSSQEQARKAQAVAYLPKPFPGLNLMAAVTDALACSRKSGTDSTGRERDPE